MRLRNSASPPVACCMVFVVALAFAASPPTYSISSEGDPTAPVPSFEGLIVNAGNSSASGNFTSGASYIAAPRRYAKVDGAPVLAGSDNPQPSLADCSRSCAVTPRCSVFLYCGAGDGPCDGVNSDGTIPELGCELAIQSEALPKRMVPFMVLTPDQGAPEGPATLVSGAPITTPAMASTVPISGYLELYAQSYFNLFDYNCTGTLIDGSCALPGAPTALAATCDGDPLCAVMVWYPEGREDLGPGSVTLLKGGKGVLIGTDTANLNHRAVSYLKLGRDAAVAGGAGSSLSDGAVAGIAVGAAVAGAALAAGGILLARRSRVCAQHDGKTDLEQQTNDTPQGSGGTASGNSSKPSRGSVSRLPGGGITVVPHRAPISPFDTTQTQPNPRRSLSSLSSFPIHESTVSASVAAAAAAGSGGPPTPPRPGTSSTGGSSAGGASHSGDRFIAASPTTVTIAPNASAAGILAAIRDAPEWSRYSIAYPSITWLRRPDGTLDELGHGAFARVYKVTLDGAMALAAKVIPLEDVHAELVFQREVKTLFHLRHPNIVQFFGVCIHEGQGILLMELMEGGSLFAAMGARGNDGARAVGWGAGGKRIALGVAQALAYLHSLGQIHLDIKSANVLLTRDGTPKVADVGFTRLRDTLDGVSSNRDSRIGTFAYMAPELLMGSEVSAAADIYSFGVLLREICTGEYPSRGRARLPRVPEECPQAVTDLIVACMRAAPEERPSAREVHAALLACPQ